MFVVRGCYCPNEAPLLCKHCTMEREPNECEAWRIENKAQVVLSWEE
jgi:hypothetical protein